MRGLVAVAIVVMMAGLAGCGDDSGGGDDSSGAGDQGREKGCELAMSSLASGLQEYARTRVVGDFLEAIAMPASVPCRNAIANIQQGRAVTFDLLRPNGEILELPVSPRVVQYPVAVPTVPASDDRTARCSATFGGTFLYNPCLNGDIDPF
ncbi:hypothetical protein [Terrabacter sp. Ter38]|uniref:hypothetical protein n=1 Tax=Terrabacter sp. Ter38 TaxID=2926030 RepID=UPI0021176026|nr:hypothetical protein [Terrabacter sp. Ter38]